MGRPTLVRDEDLLERLSLTFRDVGYEAASMAMLSKRTGLKRASLYHRFPNGKAQMAREVLSGADVWLDQNILAPLRTDAAPRDRIALMIEALGQFYQNGQRACLLNMLSAPMGEEGRFSGAICRTIEAWIDALASCVADASVADEEARARAMRAIALIQGSLVLSRGLGSTGPFRDALAGLSDELLGSR